MDNDALRHELVEVRALVEDQMKDFVATYQKRTELRATGSAARGQVQVTVDAQRAVTNVLISDSYLDESDLTDLGRDITVAAQAAARQIDEQSSALLAPLSERNTAISAVSRTVGRDVEVDDMLEKLKSLVGGGARVQSVSGLDETDEPAVFPTIRR